MSSSIHLNSENESERKGELSRFHYVFLHSQKYYTSIQDIAFAYYLN